MNKKKEKIIQDPVHGCITVEEDYFDILNSVQFQRLKLITQSSFRVLYPGATHDRFIHSLGTYHLAKKAATNFLKNIKDDISNDVLEDMSESEESLRATFLYAALLHDVGHAPFSHTCEEYFANAKDKNNRRKIDNELIQAIGELKEKKIISEKIYIEFEDDYMLCLTKKDKVNSKPSPHEIISATMLVKDRDKFWNEKKIAINYEMAARMVIGLKYRSFEDGNEKRDKVKKIGNCLIRLLNSPCLDVDKLDYICRDTKMTGFNNVQLDIERITLAFTAVKRKGSYELVFRKNMLSVIDNVFRAKIEQGTWLISHPAVAYENNLIQRCIGVIEKIETSELNDYVKNIFSYEALTEQGITYRDKNYRLLSDTDIISDFKHFLNAKGNVVIKEYFDRGIRRKPLWKSYKEYLYFFHDTESQKASEYPQKVFEYFKGLIKYLKERHEVLNYKTFECIKEEQEPEILKVAELLKNLCEKSNVEFNMVLVEVENDFANKISTEDVYIKFNGDGEETLIPYDSLQSVKEKKSMPFFYLYNKQPLDREWFQKKVLEAVQNSGETGGDE